MMSAEEILTKLPYKRPFLFVDQILSVDDDECKGSYTVREDEYFFLGHFPGHPVVPGVILTEIMAQIGLVCLGICLTSQDGQESEILPAFTSSNIDFLATVYPGERLIVESKKIYFRFGKLKCEIVCKKEDGTRVASGECSGMMIKKEI